MNGQLERVSNSLTRPVREAEEGLVALWLHGRSPHTQTAYRRDIERFLTFVACPLPAATLADLHSFADSLEDAGLSPASIDRTLSAVKSLYSFAHHLGLLPANVGGALRVPKHKNLLSERILSEPAVQRLLALEPNPRNKALLRLLYGAGLRAAEASDLTWRDLQERGEAGQFTVFGKGGKTRVILVTVTMWREVMALRGDAGPEESVFPSQKGGPLTTTQVWRIVRAAAERAGLEMGVSPHWLRHAHASHALDRGAPIHLVQQTLGHASVATTSRYLHARPGDSSARYLAV